MNNPMPSQPERKDVVSVDLWNAGYDVTFSDHRFHPDNPQITRQSPDALVVKDGVDYFALSQRALFTVNGLIHPTSASEHGLYILDGYRNTQRNGQNHASIIDFGALGAIQTHPIKDAYIWNQGPVDLKDSLFISLPDIDLSDKTVFFVLGGFLLPLHDLYRVISDNTIRLDLHTYPLVERFMESRDRIDLSSIAQGDIFAPEGLYTDRSIRKLLTNKHSFIVTLDATGVGFEEKVLQLTDLPGRYRSTTMPVGILHNADGTIAEYVLHGSENDVLIVGRYKPQQPTRYSTLMDEPIVTDNSRHPTAGVMREVPYLLSIFKSE